jgi:glycerophosphoryl diester phosphodiesterase
MDALLLREPVAAPPGGESGNAGIRTRLTGAVSPLLALALGNGLAVHPYTLRPEPHFLTLWPDGTPQSMEQAIAQLLSLGVAGFFVDDPLAGRRAVERHFAPTGR